MHKSNIGELTTEYGRYTLFPQGKIFICFSGNTEKYVSQTQNKLLLENLRSKQVVDWQPTAWNVAGHIDTFSKEGIYTQLLETIFNKDYSKMNIRYVFGPIGMGIQMVGKYSFIGDGKQIA